MSFVPPKGVLGDLCAAARARADEARRLPLPTPPRRPPFALRSALRRPGRFPLVCEIKRASPSAGVLRAGMSVVDQARAYDAGGAAAISVLTEPSRFMGSLGDLADVRAVVDLPILRKDFIMDPWMVDEAHAHGADAVLLIAAALPPDHLLACASHADALGLDSLLELSSERDLETLELREWPIVGINTRDLETLAMHEERFGELVSAALAPGRILIAESGIRDAAILFTRRREGAQAALIGEALVRADDPASLVRAWSVA
jgi:indole-3-glycerol phosphate synthase